HAIFTLLIVFSFGFFFAIGRLLFVEQYGQLQQSGDLFYVFAEQGCGCLIALCGRLHAVCRRIAG
ncbi:MAG: hypothetical protein IJP92_11085, partial [Lachnospiraceae bacterium]|nr:hypothetical protein [Lachnospiraceae bacterium]